MYIDKEALERENKKYRRLNELVQLTTLTHIDEIDSAAFTKLREVGMATMMAEPYALITRVGIQHLIRIGVLSKTKI